MEYRASRDADVPKVDMPGLTGHVGPMMSQQSSLGAVLQRAKESLTPSLPASQDILMEVYGGKGLHTVDSVLHQEKAAAHCGTDGLYAGKALQES